MTPEEGYELARKQRPGVKIVMGPTEAREERMEPVNNMTRLKWYLDLPGDSSWGAYGVRKVCSGKLPHGIALGTGAFVDRLLKRPLTQANAGTAGTETTTSQRQHTTMTAPSARTMTAVPADWNT